MKLPNFYVSTGLDRVGQRRKDADWLAAQLADPRTRIVPVWRSQNLVLHGRTEAAFLTAAALAAFEGEPVLLGVHEEVTFFAIDLSHHPSPLASLGLDGAAEFTDLRRVGPLLDARDGSLLAYARGMAYWHQRHRFCGVCGSPTRATEAGHVRLCTSQSCKAQHFPRTDPAVIMLVHDGDRCLLGRQAAWARGMHSTLAGFVEPGESLEQAVAREVKEETGIDVTDVEYHSSQPWPFPCSVMLGFHARATSSDVHVDESELQAARWFQRDWLLEHRDDDEFRLPRRDSIARRLIEDWLQR